MGSVSCLRIFMLVEFRATSRACFALIEMAIERAEEKGRDLSERTNEGWYCP